MSRSEALEALARLVHAIDTVESRGSLGSDPLFVECFAAARNLTVGVRVWPRPASSTDEACKARESQVKRGE